MFVKLFGTCSQPLTIMLIQGNLPIRQRLPQLESLVLQLVVPHRSSDEARQYLDNPGHDDAITRHHYKPLYAICFNVFAYQCRAPLYFAYQFSHEKFSQKLTHDQAKHSSLEEIQGDCAEQEGWLEGIPAFPGHCEQGSTEGPPH